MELIIEPSNVISHYSGSCDEVCHHCTHCTHTTCHDECDCD